MVISRIFKLGIRILLSDSNSGRFANSETAPDNPVVTNAPLYTRCPRGAEDKKPVDPLTSQFLSCADCTKAMT